MNAKWIAVKSSTFDRYVRKVEREEIAARGISVGSSWFSCNSCLMEHGARIEEIRGNVLLISGDWRKALREGAMAKKGGAA